MDACKQDLINFSLGKKVDISHKACDGAIVFAMGSFICSRCVVSWRLSWIQSIDEADIGMRFKINPPADANTYKLVEVKGDNGIYSKLEKADKIDQNDDNLDDFAKEMSEFFFTLKW
jgi:hypothetical protein